MRAVVQRAESARVESDGAETGRIGRGLVAFVGFCADDTAEDYGYIAGKILGLRIFEDGTGKMNLPVDRVGGGILLIPNFTLYGDARKGKRPDFMKSSGPSAALVQYEEFLSVFRGLFPSLQTGSFRSHMTVDVRNDGPVTILLDSKKLF